MRIIILNLFTLDYALYACDLVSEYIFKGRHILLVFLVGFSLPGTTVILLIYGTFKDSYAQVPHSVKLKNKDAIKN